MSGLRLHSLWSRWIGLELMQWGVAFAVFFGLPWAHYHRVLAPQLEPVSNLREVLDQELTRVLKRGDWERWAGEAMQRIQIQVHEAMGAPIAREAVSDTTRISTDSLKVVMSSVKSESRAQPRSKPQNKPANILLRVQNVGPDDIVWTALNDFYAAPYLWGGNTVFGVDCSGLVKQVFHRVGVVLPRTAETQFDSELGVYVGLNDLRPGDLVFFHTRSRPYVSHVGIYIGNNEFLHASRTGRRVEITPIDGYYKKRFIAGKRIIADPFGRFSREEQS